MVECSCGKTLEKVPNWLQTVTVEFICNNCPNRQTKNIAFLQLEPAPVKATETDGIAFTEEEEEPEA